MRDTILIVDDDRNFAERLAGCLEGAYNVMCCHSEAQFHEVFSVGRFDLLMLDMRLSEGQEGLELLRGVLERDPAQAAIVMTAYSDMESYALALESGALSFLDKAEFSPMLIARIVEAILTQGALRGHLSALERHVESLEPIEIVGASSTIVAVRHTLHRVAGGRQPVAVAGEPGTGRRLVARNLHRFSAASPDGPFVAVSGLPIEPSEAARRLLGTCDRDGNTTPGWVDRAQGGTLFVPNAERLAAPGGPLHELLRSGTFSRVGGKHRLSLNTRLVLGLSALGALGELGGAGHMVKIHLPPLRQRPVDIPLLAHHTLSHLFRHGRARVRTFREEAIAYLETLEWRENVRELKVSVSYGAIAADNAQATAIGPEHLPACLSTEGPTARAMPVAFDYALTLARAEIGLVEAAIAQFKLTTKTAVAKRLQYNDRYVFSRRMRRLLVKYPFLFQEFPVAASLFPDVAP